MTFSNLLNPEILRFLKQGKIGVFPSDTLYGIHADALNPEAIEKIYKIKEREPNKPFIILISKPQDLNLFGIEYEFAENILNTYWPGSLSVVFPCFLEKFKYLHRGGKSLAFRLPAKQELQKLISQTGPLASTTVNISGEPPIETAQEAVAKFGEEIDFYVDEGKVSAPPSTVITFENGKVVVLRQGALKII